MTISTDIGYSLTATPDHRIYCDGKWATVASLKHGDALLCCHTHSQNLIETRVVGVSSCPEAREVYDLTVANEHCFFANGILVHNCLQYASMEARQVSSGRSFLAPMADAEQHQSRASARPVKVVNVGTAYA